MDASAPGRFSFFQTSFRSEFSESAGRKTASKIIIAPYAENANIAMRNASHFPHDLIRNALPRFFYGILLQKFPPFRPDIILYIVFARPRVRKIRAFSAPGMRRRLNFKRASACMIRISKEERCFRFRRRSGGEASKKSSPAFRGGRAGSRHACASGHMETNFSFLRAKAPCGMTPQVKFFDASDLKKAFLRAIFRFRSHLGAYRMNGPSGKADADASKSMQE